ncbi:hypothetical protein ACQCN2_12985 [Brevibacillus ginsengisoli]|uniref:hypothetical protein n=1 Tax=Brevibacillus ginsengisoli TaxID=363854 RepID=UPI003CEDDCE2
MKKVVASLLGLALVAGLSGGAMAQEVNKVPNKTVTINGITYTDEREPNDTEATADSYTEGNVIRGELPQGDFQDYFTFTAKNSGTYRMKMQPAVSSNTYELWIKKPGSSYFKKVQSQADVTLENGQVYILRVLPVYQNYTYSQAYTASVSFVQ